MHRWRSLASSRTWPPFFSKERRAPAWRDALLVPRSKVEPHAVSSAVRLDIVLRPLAVPSRCLALPCLALPCLFCWRWISRLVRMDVFCVHAPVTGYDELVAGTAATATYVCTNGVLTQPSLTCTPGISATPSASRFHSFPSWASYELSEPTRFLCRRLFDRLRSSGSCTFPAMPEGTKPSSREPP